MSFMFHPYPYVDHEAVNVISGEHVKPVRGVIAVAKKIMALLSEGKNVGIDAYPGTDLRILRNVLRQVSGSTVYTCVDAASLLKDADAIEEMLLPYLPEDREEDPVLLYGRRYEGGYAGLQVLEKVMDLKNRFQAGRGMLVIGQGALTAELQSSYDIRIWVDVTPRTAALNFKYGHVRNVGGGKDLPYSLLMRRNYYVDFENAIALRWQLIRDENIQYYITADVPEECRW